MSKTYKKGHVMSRQDMSLIVKDIQILVDIEDANVPIMENMSDL